MDLIKKISLPSFDVGTFQTRGRILHDVRATGRFALKERLPLYHSTLALNPSEEYFCILDNRDRHENVFTFDDMYSLGHVMAEAGVKTLYAATVTADQNYGDIVHLANVCAESQNIGGEIIVVPDMAAAERFIFQKMLQAEAA